MSWPRGSSLAAFSTKAGRSVSRPRSTQETLRIWPTPVRNATKPLWITRGVSGAYRTVLDAFPGRKVVIRTLDAGSDKPLPFLGIDQEPNPALGVRGVRTADANPEILDSQLIAIAQAATESEADVWVMAPTIATATEADSFVDRCDANGLTMAGVMIETPAAALMSETILATARFASLGTNDLARYTMGADRLSGELAHLTDPWQPAVLKLIDKACRSAAARDRPIGLCGEAAADPTLALVMVVLGVTSLSMAPAALPAVAGRLATTDYERCRSLAAIALAADKANEARRLVSTAIGRPGRSGS